MHPPPTEIPWRPPLPPLAQLLGEARSVVSKALGAGVGTLGEARQQSVGRLEEYRARYLPTVRSVDKWWVACTCLLAYCYLGTFRQLLLAHQLSLPCCQVHCSWHLICCPALHVLCRRQVATLAFLGAMALLSALVWAAAFLRRQRLLRATTLLLLALLVLSWALVAALTAGLKVGSDGCAPGPARMAGRARHSCHMRCVLLVCSEQSEDSSGPPRSAGSWQAESRGEQEA